jgi:hypothetical protein
MKTFFRFALGLLVLGSLAHAQNPTAQQYAKIVNAAELKDNLTILASDLMEGRETGTRGEKMAAAFIAASFEENGLIPPVNGSYYQTVELYKRGIATVAIKGTAGDLKPGDDFLYIGNGGTTGMLEQPVLFVGRATEADIKNIDPKGKAIAVLADNVMQMRTNTALNALVDKGAGVFILMLTHEEDYAEIRPMLSNPRRNAIVLSNKPAAAMGTLLMTPTTAAKALFGTTPEALKEAADKGAAATVKPGKIAYSITQSYAPLKTANVLGLVEGTDKKDEYIVVTAHYDHIGIRPGGSGDRINNGADDDGSGTVTVMQLAKAFAQAKKDGKGPRRSVLFMAVTGEEKGLLGSDYYTQHPVFPLANTVVNLNIDMIGRYDTLRKVKEPYVYVIGSDKLSKELHSLSENTNATTTKLALDYLYNAESHPERIYYRSDHWNFAKNNIPIIFYFDGLHADYHGVGDEVSKIEFDLMEKRAQLVFYTAWEIANRDGRITSDVKPDKK